MNKPPMQNPISQGVKQAVNREQQASPEEQSQYDYVVEAAALMASQAAPDIKKRLKKGDPSQALAQVTVSVLERTVDLLAQQGMQVPDNVLMAAGNELMAYIHEKAGMTLTPEQQELAKAQAIDLYLAHQEQAGTLDTQGIQQMARMIKDGTFPPIQQQEGMA